ncbi:MAG TPA: type VI secretion system baseplate subunit TssG [Candidatus Angelobacter sp.]|jgi:type VI secretion system protein ImpH|nr:type VI secretion system baseplate subunit TssG [Candidatus Angelobacter sp.]
MAAFGWQREKSVEEWLFSEAYRFDFFQAVRLLELIFPDCAPVGEGPEPEKEPVRFSARVGFDFPAGEVHDLLPSTDGGPPCMVTNFLGLAGATGPLPVPLAELMLERIRQKDTGLRDFLDIFNHRLVSLMYRVRKVHRVTLSSQSPEQGPMANYLFAFLGLGISGLRNRMGKVSDRVLLPYAGLLNQQPRSMIGMELLLSDHFRSPVKVEQFSGVWRNIEPDQWSSLGRLGKNQVLGQSIVLGKRIWDQQGRFLVIVGPLPLQQFLDFLPDGTAYNPLCALARFYAGPEFEFRVRLKIQAAEIPELRLGKSKLGWTTWLKTRPVKRDSQVELSSEALSTQQSALSLKREQLAARS